MLFADVDCVIVGFGVNCFVCWRSYALCFGKCCRLCFSVDV